MVVLVVVVVVVVVVIVVLVVVLPVMLLRSKLTRTFKMCAAADAVSSSSRFELRTCSRKGFCGKHVPRVEVLVEKVF